VLDRVIRGLSRQAPNSSARAALFIGPWKAGVGAYLARNSRPLRFYQATLVVAVKNRAIAEALQVMAEDILGRLNREGLPRVQRLEISIQSHWEEVEEEAPMTPEAPDIDDPTLPPVREELRPIIHRLIRLQRERDSGKN
jgi:hypothetical protein